MKSIFFMLLFVFFIHKVQSQNNKVSTNIKTMNSAAESLEGGWGARLYVRGGEDLDDYVGRRGYDYVAGAQEIVDNYTTMNHVITNATNNANSQLWTLRTNENVDAIMGASGSIIDEEFVPSIDNEQVIIDVITLFKNTNKKVILYLNGMSPANRATADGAIAWNAYVSNYFSDDEHKAWMNLCEGYMKRFAALGVDGYWIDAFSSYPGNDTERAEFVQMIRNVDPDVILATNLDKDYFVDDEGVQILVDTDGVDDADERDYRVIKLTAKDPWSDFTAGHITPLGQGAPPNSWAYEEFTVPDVQDSPITTYDGSKQTLKHLFLPIRSTWSSERTDLMFDGEQAYRFVKRITDAGGSVTFSTTTNTDGTTMEDEETVLKYVNEQLLLNADPSEYVRPEGAYLVGEDQNLSTKDDIYTNTSLKIYPNPVTNSFKLSKAFISAFVYTITGQKIIEFSSSESNLDVSKLNTGLYLLRVYGEEGNSEVVKFMKN